jgi:hypothetical protein
VSEVVSQGEGNARVIETRYDDPLNLVWLHCAARLGMTVVRSREVFAAWDGQGTLTLADQRDFDADDCLAQMIFHEICHGLVAGPDAWGLPDWGLYNRDNRDIDSEYATHRLQAALAGRYGLRVFMGPTTEHRPYYDSLPDDPLATNEDLEQEASVAAAQAGFELATHGARGVPVKEALEATAAIARVMGGSAAVAGSLWSGAGGESAMPSQDGE